MNRKYSTLISVNLTLLLTALSVFIVNLAHGSEMPDTVPGRVIKVNDGDTVTVVIGRRHERIRLIGIDAPELGQRPWGRKAKEHIKEIIDRSNSTVIIEFDVQRRDRYRRLLAYLWTRDRHLINFEMLRDGYAVLYTFPPNIKYVDTLRDGQRQAREKRLGIWERGGLKEMPSEYRKRHPRLD